MSNSIDLDRVTTLLFDIGGVLVDLQGPPFHLDWLSSGMTEQQVWDYWLQSDVVKAFEHGRITPQQFAQKMIEETSLDVDAEEFLSHFLTWPKELYCGVEAALVRLKTDYHLAALSNSNIWHWSRLMEDLGLARLLHTAFSSHALGVMKPSADAFSQVLGKMNVAADEVLFFDDLAANVVAAREIGMQAVQVNKTLGVVNTLREIKIFEVSGL